MKRLVLVLSVMMFFGGSLFAENNKFDSALKRKIQDHKERRANGAERIRIIVQRLTPASPSELEDLGRKGARIVRQFNSIRAHALEVPLSQLERMGDNANVLHISLDDRVRSHAGTPYVASGAVQAVQAYGVTGAGIGVAVIDSGIGVHPDLSNVIRAVDFVQPANTGGNDPFGHGTHVAGIIAGSGSASGGAYHGMSPNVKLVDLRVLDSNGQGYTSDVIAAIEWAIQHRNDTVNGNSLNIRIINLSLGHQPYEPTSTDPLTTVCRIAVRNGIVVVVAAGNFGKDSNGNVVHGGITSPGNEPAVLTVGAMTTWGTDSRMDDTVASYSSRGPTVVENVLKPDIVAPGSKVVAASVSSSFLATNYPQLQVGSGYIALSGTSMATGVASGAVAMMLQANPHLTPNAVKAALMFTAENRRETPLEEGAGYINVMGAVNLAANINTTVPAGMYWILNNGLNLQYSNYIAGSLVVWGQTIVWDDALFSGNAILYNQTAWSQTIVWGVEDTSWATTIVWETDALALSGYVGGLTIVWEEALTIVWDDF
ncbi:MAG: S8 family peptidase [Acidobacteria bacterium]|nr:S8 family peptidase [Acidobacteriota bacterium]